jgi:fucose permease
VLIGLFLIMVGLPGINAQDFAVCLAAIFVYGSGLGVTIPGINLLTIENTETHLRSSAVNLINFSWGVGAICSQPFVAAVSRDDSLVSVTVILGVALLLLAISFFSAVRRFPHRAVAEPADASKPSRIWRNPSSWLFVAFGFFVVSIEGGLGGWLTTYSEVLKLRGVHTINLTVIYFLFFVLGRGVASIVSRRISENSLILLCSIILVAGVLIIVSNESWSIVGAAVAGLGSSAIFPTHMVRFARVFGPQATLQAAPIFIAGTSGAAVVSSLVGFVSSMFGDLRSGIMVVVISAAFVLVLHLVIAAVFRPASKPAAEV